MSAAMTRSGFCRGLSDILMVTGESGFVLFPIGGIATTIPVAVDPDIRIISVMVGGFAIWRVLDMLSSTIHFLSRRVIVYGISPFHTFHTTIL
jgi:hypothetical protein